MQTRRWSLQHPFPPSILPYRAASQLPKSRASKASVRGHVYRPGGRHMGTVAARVEDFFPEHDLDKPVIEMISGGTSPTGTNADQTPPVQLRRACEGKKSIRLSGSGTLATSSRVEEVDTSSLPESPSTSEGPTTYKWVRMGGSMYLAFNATTGEMIAVKQALKLESEMLKVLDHSNIVQYSGFEETQANLSIFLDYVPGGSTGSCLLKHRRFDEDATKSLEYLHSKGILHRDLKSDNILVDLSDDQNDAHAAMQSTVFWMAPGKGYSFKIDIRSIDCVVLEMWAGTRPWLGDEVVAVMFNLFQSKLPPPVPDSLVLTPLANDCRKKCFAMYVLISSPSSQFKFGWQKERPTVAELRKH
ncbi:kinase-like domain-containing protein [Mycena polygramma]|nr:kinase-like domain-containing protein [Mycena polygramma]